MASPTQWDMWVWANSWSGVIDRVSVVLQSMELQESNTTEQLELKIPREGTHAVPNIGRFQLHPTYIAKSIRTACLWLRNNSLQADWLVTANFPRMHSSQWFSSRWEFGLFLGVCLFHSAVMNIWGHVSWGKKSRFLVDIYLGEEWLCYVAHECSVLCDLISVCFPKWLQCGGVLWTPQPLQHLVLLTHLNLTMDTGDELDLDVGLSCIFLIPKEVRHLLNLHALFWWPMSSFACFPHFLLGMAAFFILKLLFKDCTIPSEGYTTFRACILSKGKSVLGSKKSYSFHVENIAIHILYKQIFGISVVLKFHKRWLGKKCLKTTIGVDNAKNNIKHWFIALYQVR